MGFIASFLRGLNAHRQGIGFALSRPRMLVLLLIPFALTILIYTVGFYIFTMYDDKLLAYFWSISPSESEGFMSVLYWLYTNVVKVLLWVFVFFLMYYLYMVIVNILASPLYDYIAGKTRELRAQEKGQSPPRDAPVGMARIVMEEVKKAAFILVIPLLLMFLPVVGAVFSFIFAAALLAWDFIDFAMARDLPVLKSRLRTVGSNIFLFLGFGLPLLVPFLNFLLFPFAVVGGSLLYMDHMHAKMQEL